MDEDKAVDVVRTVPKGVIQGPLTEMPLNIAFTECPSAKTTVCRVFRRYGY